jgi:protein phosphatase
MKGGKTMYNIGQLSQLTGLTRRTLRFYETKGLLIVKKRRDNKYRTYSEEDLKRVIKIQFFKKLGFSLDEIVEILNILGQGELFFELEIALKNRLNLCINEINELVNQEENIKKVLDILKHYRTISFDNIEHLKLLSKKERSNIMDTLRFEYVSKSIIGKRKENQDKTIVKEGEDGNLYLIADGFGGHDDGLFASHLVCDIIAENLDFNKITEESFEDYFKNLINMASKEIYSQSEKNNEKRMGTTVSFLVIKDSKAYVGHVGDTRIYRMKNNEFVQLTKDHTRIQKLIDKGEILQKDITGHPLRNMLYTAVGYDETVKDIFTFEEDLFPGVTYLLTSDGITSVLSDSEILKEMNRGAELEKAVENLIKLAERHGEDNATALGVRI